VFGCGQRGGDWLVELTDLYVLMREDLQELELAIVFRIAGRKDVGCGTFDGGLEDGALALGVVVLEEVMRVL